MIEGAGIEVTHNRLEARARAADQTIGATLDDARVGMAVEKRRVGVVGPVLAVTLEA